MKILIVSQYFWPEDFAINGLAQSLQGKGHTVEVLTGNPNYPEGNVYPGRSAGFCGSEAWHDVLIHRVPLIPRGKRSGLRLAINYFSFVICGIVLAPWLLRGRKYDVILVYAVSPLLMSLPASFIGWLKRCPVALWVQDLWPESLRATGYVKSKFALSVIKRVVRFIYQRTDLLLIQSEGFRPSVAKLSSGIPIQYYPNSADSSFFTPQPIVLPSISELDNGFSVLFAGNVGTAQAVEVIVEAADLLRDESEIRFVVLGSGSRWDWMQEQVCMRGLSNLFLPGRFPSNTMPGLMRKASVLLVTLADEEIFAATIPNKVQAYLATGVPIIACLNGEGAKIVLDAGAGLTVPAEDAKALAAAVLSLKGMPAINHQEMGQRGRAYFQSHFDHDLLVDRLIEILSSLSCASSIKTAHLLKID
jgi:glycosyltransferase involved in cell wall biosynthesis